MTFGEKLLELRKKSGLSKEDLAKKMNVSVKIISKWEESQSIIDFDIIIRLSELFGVSTDYFLKDDKENHINSFGKSKSKVFVSLEDAKYFLIIKEKTANSIAFATFLCILSPQALFILGAIGDDNKYSLTENMAGIIGVAVFMIFLALAISIFVVSGKKTEPFSYLENETFETEDGVIEIVRNLKSDYKDTYSKSIVAGVFLCTIALIPLLLGAIFNENNAVFLTTMLSISFIIAGIGVTFFIKSGIIWESFKKILQEGDYSKKTKMKRRSPSSLAKAYWIIVASTYIGYSFSTNNWNYSWLIWIVAAIIYPFFVKFSEIRQ